MSKHWQPPMSAKEQVEALRKRDGGRCWLCGGPMNFKAEQPSPKAPTIEHLIAKSRLGPNTIDNLVLCHQPCNLELGDLPLVDKIKKREARREDAWKAAMRKRIGELLIG